MKNKHRGIKIDGSGWVYGERITVGEQVFILESKSTRGYSKVQFFNNGSLCRLTIDCHEVIPETVGVFTGLSASKAKKHLSLDVFEGDKFRMLNKFDVEAECVAMWIDQRAAFYLVPIEHYPVLRDNDCSKEPEFDWLFCEAMLHDFNDCEILTKIGTIHDHLLNEKKEENERKI